MAFLGFCLKSIATYESFTLHSLSHESGTKGNIVTSLVDEMTMTHSLYYLAAFIIGKRYNINCPCELKCVALQEVSNLFA